MHGCMLTVVFHQAQDIVLPVEVDVMEAQLAEADILLLIFSEYSMNIRNSKVIEQQKSSIQKVCLLLFFVLLPV